MEGPWPRLPHQAHGIAAWITREFTQRGLAPPHCTPEALARALVATLGTTWDEAVLRRRAEEYSWTRLAERIRTLYEELTSRHNRSITTA